MANQEHLNILMRGREAWNEWRKEHPELRPDLSRASLRGSYLGKANLSEVNLSGANLSGANLIEADLSGANLSLAHLRGTRLNRAVLADVVLTDADLLQATLSQADLLRAKLRRANLTKADLRKANLTASDLRRAHLNKADLSEADLSGANLSGAQLYRACISRANLSEAHLNNATLILANLTNVNLSGAHLNGANLSDADLSGTNLSGANLSWTILSDVTLSQANLTGCSIYSTSAWNVLLKDTTQLGLIITRPDEPAITVDNLEVAQFIYLLLNNKKIRDVIDTITSKVVLILGRFTEERKKVLDALRDELRKQNYSPVVFDFERPANRDVTETVSTLAHLARFVIADITEPKSIPQELSHIVPFLPSVPIVPLLHISEREYGMYEHFVSYPWVEPIYHYRNLDELLHSIQERIIDPAEKKVKELAIEKAKRLERR